MKFRLKTAFTLLMVTIVLIDSFQWISFYLRETGLVIFEQAHHRYMAYVSSMIIMMTLLCVSLRLIHITLKRLQLLSDDIQKMTRSHYQHRATMTDKQDEVDQLAQALNQMASSMLSQQTVMIKTSKMIALGEMAGGIAHEINNPLAVVIGRAFHIRAGVKEQKLTTEQLIKFAEDIETSGNRIKKIVQGLRSIAHQGESDPLETVSVHDMLGDVLNLCQSRFRNHGIDLKVDLIQDKDIMVLCRPSQVTQALVNLLNNSFDAILAYQHKWVEVTARVNGQMVDLRVEDCGPGIPVPMQERLFVPFFTTKEIGKGTGLGLSVSKGLLESQGGRLFLDTTRPYTSFVVQVPKSTIPVKSSV